MNIETKMSVIRANLLEVNNKAKHWTYVVNNYTQEDIDNLDVLGESSDVVYIIYGREVGEEGTPHLQGYVCFSDKKTRRTVSRLIPRSRLAVKYGTVLQASNYCKKDGIFTEHGNLPMEQTAAATERTLEIWQETRDLAQAGRLEEIAADHYIRFYSTLKNIRDDARNKKVPTMLDWVDGEPPNEWIYGPTGTGKSFRARADNPVFFIKNCTKWWDDYEDEPVVIIEDIGQSHLWMGDHLKIWADRYGFRSEVKHGSRTLRPARIIVTSNYHPNELWSDRSVYEPLLRRFKLVHLTVRHIHEDVDNQDDVENQNVVEL